MFNKGKSGLVVLGGSAQFGKLAQSRLRMNHGDLSVVGLSGGTRPFRVAAAVTRYFAGEPMMRTPTYTNGATNANNIVVLTDAKPRVATDDFIGIAAKDAPGTGTLTAHKASVIVPIPNITIIRGRAKTATGLVDTDANLLGILGDLVDFDLTAAAYTIDATAASNASALQIVDGNIAKGTVDVWVDARGLRTVIS